MPVPRGIDFLGILQHLLQIERPVGRHAHIAAQQVFPAQLQRIRKGRQLSDALVHADKVTVFQPVVFLFQFIAVQDLGQLRQGNILGGDLQIHQLALDGYPHLNADALSDRQSVKAVGAHHLAQPPEGFHALRQDTIDAVLIRSAGETAVFLQFREELLHPEQHGALPNLVAEVCRRHLLRPPVRQGKARPVAVIRRGSADRRSVFDIQEEAEADLRRKVSEDLFPVRFRERHALRQFRHDVIVEVGEKIPSDVHIHPAVIRRRQQRLQHAGALSVDPGKPVIVQAVVGMYPLDHVRELSSQDHAVKRAVFGLILAKLQLHPRYFVAYFQPGFPCTAGFPLHAAAQRQFVEIVQQRAVQSNSL